MHRGLVRLAVAIGILFLGILASPLGSFNSAQAVEPPVDKLEGYYRFDEGNAASLMDFSGYNRTGTLAGATWSEGKISSGLAFDGRSQNVSVANFPNIIGDFSVTTWIKKSSNEGTDVIASKTGSYANWYLRTVGDELVWAHSGGDKYHETVGLDIEPNVWYHVAAVYSDANDTVELFVNGARRYSGKETKTASPYSEPLRIGSGYNTDYFHGSIDELRIYSRTLNQSEIEATMLVAPDAAPASSSSVPAVPSTPITTTPPANTATISLDDIAPGEWREVSNSRLETVLPNPYPPNWGGPQSIMKAWNSGVLDTSRNRLIIWGGGHADWAGNEIYSFDLNTLQWSRIWGPTANVQIPPIGGTTADAYPDGNPASRHTYGGIQYIPSTDQMFSTGGALYSNGNGTWGTWVFNFSTLTWQKKDNSTQVGTWTSTAYDPTTQHIFSQTDHSFDEYNPVTGSWIKRGTISEGMWEADSTAAIDPVRRLFVMVGQGRLRVWNLNTWQLTQPVTAGGDAVVKANAPGFEYYPPTGKFIAWAGGTSVYELDPATWRWTEKTAASTNAVTPTAPETNGTFGRFRYIPAKNLFVVVNSISQNVFVYRLSNQTATTPVSVSPAPTPAPAPLPAPSATTTPSIAIPSPSTVSPSPIVPLEPPTVSGPLNVPITVKEVVGIGATGYPISVVVPLPYGKYQTTSQFVLVNSGGAPIPAQFTVLNRWWNRDNSLRHVKIEFQPTVSGRGNAVYYLKDSGNNPMPANPVSVTDSGKEIVIETGVSTFRISRNPFKITTPDGDVTTTFTDKGGVSRFSFSRPDVAVTIEEIGPLRAVIRAEAPTKYESVSNHTHGWAVRLYAYAGKPFLKVDYQLQNSSRDKVYAAPLYFRSLSLNRPGGVAATMRYQNEMQGRVTADAVELIPALNAWTDGLYWLDDMRQVYFEVMYWFGGASHPQTFQYPPVGLMPTAWYAQTRATLDLSGIIPKDSASAKANRREPGVVDAAHRGWDNFYLDIDRKMAPSMAGGVPSGGSKWILTEDPADVYEAERAAIGELNGRPQWIAGYSYDRDWVLLQPSTNPYAGTSWRKYDSNVPNGSLAARKLDGAYLPGTSERSLPRDDQHGWFYHVEEAYYAAGNPWIKDWYQFIGEFRRTFLNNRDPFPDTASRAIGHALSNALQAYRITGNPAIIADTQNFIAKYLKPLLNPATGAKNSLCCGSVGEAAFQLGYLTRGLIAYLDEAPADATASNIVQGFVQWNMRNANFGYYVNPNDLAAKGESSGTALTMADPQAWYALKNKDQAATAQLQQYLDKGINGGARPYLDIANLYSWEGSPYGRVTQFLLDGGTLSSPVPQAPLPVPAPSPSPVIPQQSQSVNSVPSVSVTSTSSIPQERFPGSVPIPSTPSISSSIPSSISQSVPSISPSTVSFIKPLYPGLRDPEVSRLQSFLAARNYLLAGNTTGFFGPLTQKAIRQFQCDQKIICGGSLGDGWGLVGRATRAKLNEAAKLPGDAATATVLPGITFPTAFNQASLNEKIKTLQDLMKSLEVQLQQLRSL